MRAGSGRGVARRGRRGHDGGTLERHRPPHAGAAFYAPAGETAAADRALVVVHGGAADAQVRLPPPRPGFGWRLLVDSAAPGRPEAAVADTLEVAPRAVAVLREVPAERLHFDADEALGRLAAAAGIAAEWWDIAGRQSSPAMHASRAARAMRCRPTPRRRRPTAWPCWPRRQPPPAARPGGARRRSAASAPGVGARRWRGAPAHRPRGRQSPHCSTSPLTKASSSRSWRRTDGWCDRGASCWGRSPPAVIG